MAGWSQKAAWLLLTLPHVLGCSDDERPKKGDFEYHDGPNLNTTCERADPPSDSLLGGELNMSGFLKGAEYWECRWPQQGAETGHFTTPDDDLAAVTGSAVEIPLQWEDLNQLSGRNIYFTHNALTGYYVIPAPSNDNPLPVTLYLGSLEQSAEYVLSFAVDDGVSSPPEPNIGPTLNVTLYAIAVGSGDIQINLHWDTLTDLDLHVFEPSGDEIYFLDKQSASGGELDLDSYPNCVFDGDEGRGNENVFWALNSAPSGDYRVAVHMYNDCQTYAQGQTTNYRVTIIFDQSEFVFYDGQYTSGDGPMVNVAEFAYPRH